MKGHSTRTHRYDVIISGRGFLSNFSPGALRPVLVQHPPSLNPGYTTDVHYSASCKSYNSQFTVTLLFSHFLATNFLLLGLTSASLIFLFLVHAFDLFFLMGLGRDLQPKIFK